MKSVELYEFGDLSPEIKEKVKVKELNNEVEFQLEQLSTQLEDDLITEKEFYKAIGCTKYYAESTAWFVPSCYYEHHKEMVDENVNKQVEVGLYTENGMFVMIKEDNSAENYEDKDTINPSGKKPMHGVGSDCSIDMCLDCEKEDNK
jgi:hypothetical protein